MADPSNTDMINLQGDGGFLPFGALGLFHGAAIFTFIFIAFDVLLLSHKNDNKSHTYGGAISFTIIIVALICCSTILTLMIPYYLQSDYVPFPQAFADVGFVVAQWILSIGGILVLLSSLWGLMLPIEQIICAMAEDGLIFKSSTNTVDTTTKPIYGLLCAAVLSGLFAGLFTIGHLIDLLSIGTLLAFIVMAIAIVMLRFSNQLEYGSISTVDIAESGDVQHRKTVDRTTCSQALVQLFGCKCDSKPTKLSSRIVKVLMSFIILSCLAKALLVRIAYVNIGNLEVWAISLLGALLVFTVLLILLVSLQPKRVFDPGFTVPLVPLLATVSILFNMFLVTMLNYYAWIRLAVWLILGIPVYFIYKHQNKNRMPTINGISKIQGYHNNGFIAEPEPHTSTLTLTSVTEDHLPDFIETENQNISVSSNKLKVTKTFNVDYTENYPNKRTSLNELQTPEDNTATVKNIERSDNINIYSGKVIIKSRTPSPNGSGKGSLDDIVLASEIISTLSERKEPNGKVYFIDEVRQEKNVVLTETEQQSLDKKDETTAIALLDDVIMTEEELDETGKNETSTVAMIHLRSTNDEKTMEINDIDAKYTQEQGRTADSDYVQEDMGTNDGKSNLEAHKDASAMNVILPVEKTTSVELKQSSPIILEISTEAPITISNERADTDTVTAEEISADTKVYSLATIPVVPEPEVPVSVEPVQVTPVPLVPAQVVPLPVVPFLQTEVESKIVAKSIIAKNETQPKSAINEESSVGSLDFKERLTLLLGQNRFLDKPVKSNGSKTHTTPETPTLKITNSESDINRFVFADIKTRYIEHEDTPKFQIPRSKLTIDPIKHHGIDSSNISSSKASIPPPPPPKFDPVLYNTLNSKKAPRLTQDNADSHSDTSNSHTDDDTKLVTVRNKPPDEHNDDDNRETRMSAIRGKLENILRRGPPLRFSRPKSIVTGSGAVEQDGSNTAPATPPGTPLPEIRTTAEEGESTPKIEYKEPKRPFDTVHKQKILFNDVLKSISADARPSLLRANSTARHRETATSTGDDVQSESKVTNLS